MRPPFLPDISLANKCRLLFGGAVLLIVSATLLVPWVQLDSLSTDLDVRRAEQIATAAGLLTDLMGQDWTTAKSQLDQRWPVVARQLGFSTTPPRLITTEFAKLSPLFGSRGFVKAAVKRLQAEPGLTNCWKTQHDDAGRPVIRFAMAVRTGETDPNPGTLKGIIEVRTPVQRERTTWNTIAVILAGLCGGMLAILVFYLITQKLILSPVRSLRTVAEQVTSGDLEVRSEIATRDEFQKLGEAFNDMLGHMHASQQELQTINRSLDARVGELAETNVALHESNRLKSQLLANVSHELRTPLVSIIGFAELLRDAQDDPPKDRTRLKRYSQNILTSGRMLLDMINDLLDLARIEAGKLAVHLFDFELADVCQSLKDFIQPLADKKNQTFELRLSPNLPAMHSDSGKIKQILYNLLSNALKFTPAGGHIVLAAEPGEPAGETVCLSVSDTGPGIPEDRHATIFEQFKQMDASVTREHGGTGLGLAITKELVNILGGTIRVDSTVGKGSAFTVTLPVCAPIEEPASSEADDEKERAHGEPKLSRGTQRPASKTTSG